MGDQVDLLNGWKDIAAHLGRSVRSVQRWEREIGLPVHRIKTAEGQTVYASRHEIDEWRRHAEPSSEAPIVEPEGAEGESPSAAPASQAEPAAEPLQASSTKHRRRASDRRSRRVWFAAGILAVTSAVATLALRHDGSSPLHHVVPASFAMEWRTLSAYSADHKVLWSHLFDRDISVVAGDPNYPRAELVDFNGDGSPEALLPVRFAPSGESPTQSDVVYAFSTDGRERWSLSADRALTCGGTTYTSPWQVKALTMTHAPGPSRAWVSFAHHTHWPSFVVEVDGSGRSNLRYVQAGWVMVLAYWKTPSRTYLVAGGVSNEDSRAIVALVADEGPAAMLPSRGEPFRCDGPTARPVAAFELPALDVTRAANSAYSMVKSLAVVGNDLKVTLDDRGGSAIAMITPDLSVDVVLSERYWVEHQRLEMERRIDHRADICPERTQLKELRTWTPAKGWTSRDIHLSIR
jgi:hypothetical protein